MNIIKYIEGKKNEFKAKQEAVASLRQEGKEKTLLALREERKKLEKREATATALEKEKAQIKALRLSETKRRLGPAGKIAENIKQKIKEGKKQRNIFTQTPSHNPIFHSTSRGNIFTKPGDSSIFTKTTGRNPFLPEEPKKKPKQIRIIIEK